MAKRHHRRHRRFSNPVSVRGLLSAPREMLNTSYVMEAATLTAGFLLPGLVMNYVPPTWRGPEKWKFYISKIGVVSAAAVGAGMINKKWRRAVMLGGGISLLLDLYADFIAMKGPSTAPAGTNAFYGNPGSLGSTDAFFGTPGVGEVFETEDMA